MAARSLIPRLTDIVEAIERIHAGSGASMIPVPMGVRIWIATGSTDMSAAAVKDGASSAPPKACP
jgi:hypothetical protein